MKGNPRLSVGIAVYNEAGVLPELIRRLGMALAAIPGGPHEVIFIDDGSSDGSFEHLKAGAIANASLVLLRLSRNFGHQAALSAVLDCATGDATVLMDGDLQDPPEAIALFLEQYQKGYDVVYAQRSHRPEAWHLRLCYYVFYRLINRLSRIRLPLDSGDFSLLSRRTVSAIKQAPEVHRYVRGLRAWAGFRQIGVPVARQARYAGESKYNSLNLLGLAFDGIFAFSMVPLRATSLIGALATLCSTLFGIYSLYMKLFLHRSPQGFTAIILAIIFASGVQLLFLGVIGEYLGRVYDEVKGRPKYIIDETLRIP